MNKNINCGHVVFGYHLHSSNMIQLFEYVAREVSYIVYNLPPLHRLLYIYFAHHNCFIKCILLLASYILICSYRVRRINMTT